MGNRESSDVGRNPETHQEESKGGALLRLLCCQLDHEVPHNHTSSSTDVNSPPKLHVVKRIEEIEERPIKTKISPEGSLGKEAGNAGTKKELDIDSKGKKKQNVHPEVLPRERVDSRDGRDSKQERDSKITIDEAVQRKVDQWPLKDIVINPLNPEPRTFFRDLEVASVLDVQEGFADFDNAIRSGEPEDIYRTLQPLHREANAIKLINDAYQLAYSGQTLDDVLKKRFSKPEDVHCLEYARQLINSGEATAMQAIGKVPSSPEDFLAMAACIQQGVDSNNPEVVYAALTPLQRNTELMLKLAGHFKKHLEQNAIQLPEMEGVKNAKEGIEIYSYIRRMEGKAFDYARYLMGGQQMEKKAISEYTAMRLWKAMQNQTFDVGDEFDGLGGKKRFPVTYEDPVMGCGERKLAGGSLCTELSIPWDSLYIVGYRADDPSADGSKGLHMYTDMAPDVKSGEGPTGGEPAGSKPILSWHYHTAVCIDVEFELPISIDVDWASPSDQKRSVPKQKMIKRLLFDPSMSDRPLVEDNGIAMMNIKGEPVEHVSLEKFSEKMENEYQQKMEKFGDEKKIKHCYPTDKTYVFTGGRNHVGVPDRKYMLSRAADVPIPGQDAYRLYDSSGAKQGMAMGYAPNGIININRITKYIRENMRNMVENLTKEDVNKFLEGFSAFPSEAHKEFSGWFPNLHNGLKERLRSSQPSASSASEETFEERLKSILPDRSST